MLAAFVAARAAPAPCQRRADLARVLLLLQALLSCKTHYNEWEHKYGTPNVTFKDLYERDRFEFALFQRNPKGAYILDARVNEVRIKQRALARRARTMLTHVPPARNTDDARCRR